MYTLNSYHQNSCSSRFLSVCGDNQRCDCGLDVIINELKTRLVSVAIYSIKDAITLDTLGTASNLYGLNYISRIQDNQVTYVTGKEAAKEYIIELLISNLEMAICKADC